MSDNKQGLRPCAMAFAVAMALGLSGCGGGGGGGSNVRPSQPPAPPATGTGDFVGGDVNVNSGDTIVWSNDIGGSIDLIKGGAGKLVLTGSDSYTDGTTINAGTLQIGNGGTTGSITGDVVDNALLVFNRSDDVTFSGLVSGSGSLGQTGKGTLILTGANTYTGGTTISNGMLQLGNGGTTGSILGDVKDNGSLVFNRTDDVTFSGIVSGIGSLRQAGNGTLILTGHNTYTGGTTIDNGTLQLGNGGTTGSIVGNVADNGTLAFDRSDDMGFAGSVTGTGGLTKGGNGTLTLTGANGYTGATLVNAGSLYVDGDQSVATGTTTVANGATLGGKGTVGGDVTVADGATLAPGSKGATGTLTVKGNLGMSSGSTLEYSFGQANIAGGQLSDLVNVSGNLVLDGTLNVSVAPGSSFGPGVYRVFNYAGTLTDNGLSLGSVPPSSLMVQTSVAQQVNLVNTQGMVFSFWDGDAGPRRNNVVNGGNGTWESGNSLTLDNWTDASGAVNAPFSDRSFAVFQATPGTVTVDDSNGNVNAAGMQFASDGYVVQGDTIHLVGSTDDPTHSIIRVGDGTSSGAGYKTTIDSVLAGDSTLVKTDAGTLVLGGANTYSGGTTISAGTLQLGTGGMTGSITGDVTDNGALVFDRSDDVTFASDVSGSGSLEQAGTGRLILTGTNTYAGVTTIDNAALQIGDGGWTGSITGNVKDSGSLIFNRGDEVTFGGIIGGSGSLVQAGDGTLILTGSSTFTGGTTINSGKTLQLGDDLKTGSVAGDVMNNGSLVFNPGDDLSFSGTVSGSGALVKAGAGSLTLTGLSTFTGGTTVVGGTLEIGSGTLGTGPITVNTGSYHNAILRLDSAASLSNHIVLKAGKLDNAGSLINKVDSAAVEGAYGYIPTVLNHDGGSIEGIDSAVTMESYSIIKNSAGGSISGGSVGIKLNGDGEIYNDGVGSNISSSGGVGIKASGGGVIQNTGGGTIAGGSTAIYLQNGGSVVNGSGSTIETNDTGACQETGGCSIFVPASLNTSGNNLLLTNAGTIIGDVQMDPAGVNSATLWAGSSIQGDLNTGPNGYLTLQGDAGTIGSYSHAVTGKTTAFVLSKFGDGTWIIDNDELYSSTTTSIYAGTLQVGTGGVEGSIGQGGAYVDGMLVFNRSDQVTLNGDISGSGSLVQAGSGTLVLNPNYIVTLKLVINAGTLQIGEGGEPGSIYGAVLNNGSLVVDHSNDLVIGSTISGTGSLTQEGSGTLVLNAPNTYSGGTTVSSGTLRPFSRLPGNVAVKNSAVLDSISYMGLPPGVLRVAGNVSNAGKVAVHGGDSTVGGNFVQSSTGTLAVNLGSKLDVTGNATLNGGTLEVTGADSGYVSNTHTNVLTAGDGVTGTFAQLVKDSGVVFTATTIHYDANSVWLDTTGLDVTKLAAGNDFSYTAASMGSAKRVQGSFEQLNDKIASGNLAGVSGDFLHAAGQFQQAPTLQAAQASLQSLSGQLHAVSAAMTFEAIDASSRAMSDRFDNLLGKGAGVGMWTQSLNVGGDMARAGFDGVGFQLNGWLVGSDRQIGRSGVAGFAFGQSQGQQRLNQSFDHDNSRSTEGMLYAGWLKGDLYAQGRFGFGHFQQDVRRQLLLGESVQGVGTQYSGNYNVAYEETGLHFGRGDSHVTPYVNVQYARIDRNAFAEQGAGGFGLRSNAQTLDRWQAGLGLRAGHHWEMKGGRAMDFSARAQWQQTLAEHGEVFDASFVGLQQWQPLVGIGLSRYSGLFGVGLDATLSAHTALKFSYDYEMGQRDTAQTLSARLTVAF